MRLGIQFSRLSPRVPRRLRSSAPTQDHDVFANSLQKTLAAHRSSNRARLIRKTYPRGPTPGLFRPEIPPENRAGYQPPQASPPIPEKPLSNKPVGKKRPRRRHPGVKLQSEDQRGTNAILSQNGRLSDLRPWLKHIVSPSTPENATAYLDAEIRALDGYLTPSTPEQDRISQISTEVISLLESRIPHVPQLFGSRRTGLALSHSDIDFILPFEDSQRSLDRSRRPSATRPQIREAHLSLLRQVRGLLQDSLVFNRHVSLCEKSQVLGFRHEPTGLLLRLSCGEGIPVITEYIQDCLMEYPALRPLYVGARTLLEENGLYGQVPGGVQSDALAMLVVAFLRMNHGRFTGRNRLGDQFLAFLQFYGTEIDFQSTGVAVDPPGVFDAETPLAALDTDTTPAYLRGQRSLMKRKRTAQEKANLPLSRRLCIQDPTHYMRDLGLGCTRSAGVQRAFADAYKQLRGACDNWQGPQEDNSILATALAVNSMKLYKP